MKKFSSIYWDDIESAFGSLPATKLLIRGKTWSNQNNAFTKKDIKTWHDEIKMDNPDHPILAELIMIEAFLQNNRIALVLI